MWGGIGKEGDGGMKKPIVHPGYRGTTVIFADKLGLVTNPQLAAAWPNGWGDHKDLPWPRHLSYEGGGRI